MKKVMSVLLFAVCCFAFFSNSAMAKTRPEPSVKIGNLIWLSEPEVMTYSEADDFCRALTQDDGGWRLPTMKELIALYGNKGDFQKINLGRYSPYLWSSEYDEEERHQVKIFVDRFGGVNAKLHDTKGHALTACVKSSIADQVSATSQVSVEVFDKNGARISLSQREVDSITFTLPSVCSIIANFKESAYGGGAVNLYIQFQLKDGTWKETAAQINGSAPVSWHIRNLIKDELAQVKK